MSILTSIIEILVGGITGIAQGVGAGLSTLASSIFLASGESGGLSVMGTLIIIENICMVIVFALSLFSLCLWIFYIDYSERKKMSDGYYEKDLERRKKDYQFKMERKNAALDYKLRKSKLKLLKKLTVSDFFDIDDDFGHFS